MNKYLKLDLVIPADKTGEDTKRIVACVNALAGIEDPAAFVGLIKDVSAHLASGGFGAKATDLDDCGRRKVDCRSSGCAALVARRQRSKFW